MEKLTLESEELYNVELVAARAGSYDAAVSGLIIINRERNYTYVEIVKNLTFEILDERGLKFDFHKLSTRNQEWIKELVEQKILNR